MNIQYLIEKNLARLEKLDLSARPDEKLIQEAVSYLNSEAAFESIAKDPYWPKWNTPWWMMAMLYELGLSRRIPEKTLNFMADQVNFHYLHFFPFVEEEIPEGKDPFRHIICHCALGTMYKILNDAGIQTDERYPWMRQWFLKYQQDDGGLNCDESAYTRPAPKSSVLSTLPVLEAMLFYAEKKSPQETAFLDKGAAYLIKRKLFRNSVSQQIIDNDWLKLIFPRFYDYDILRGLGFLTEWAVREGRNLPLDAIHEAVEIINSKVSTDGFLRVENPVIYASDTLYHKGDNTWERKPAETFTLMDYFTDVRKDNIYLTREWYKIIDNLAVLNKKNLLV